MPYVPSKKTEGGFPDREIIDVAVESLAGKVASRISNNLSLIAEYKATFKEIGCVLYSIIHGLRIIPGTEADLGRAIYDVGTLHNYEGAYLGELNYAITRFIQRVPQIKVQTGAWTHEFRYWIYAATVEALVYASYGARNFGIGISGVFEDVKDEYKRRVNTAYEAEQIIKNGDCYDTPYYTKIIRAVDSEGAVVGYMEVMLKRDPHTLAKDVLGVRVVLDKDT